MACHKKETYGHCGHFQCPYSHDTYHGYECVELFYGSGIAFCEAGENCFERCPYSWVPGSNSPVEQSVSEWNRRYEEELKTEQPKQL